MIKRIKSGGVYEDRIGYCRAVVAGDWVHVSGTTAGGRDIPEGVVDQCASALDIIAAALEEAGAGFEHVVRVNYYLADAADFEACWSLLCRTFDEHPPAATMIEAALIHPKYKIEIEVTAYIGS